MKHLLMLLLLSVAGQAQTATLPVLPQSGGAPPQKPLTCGPYQHIVYGGLSNCKVAPECKDKPTCNLMSCDSNDSCADDIHLLTELQYQTIILELSRDGVLVPSEDGRCFSDQDNVRGVCMKKVRKPIRKRSTTATTGFVLPKIVFPPCDAKHPELCIGRYYK